MNLIKKLFIIASFTMSFLTGIVHTSSECSLNKFAKCDSSNANCCPSGWKCFEKDSTYAQCNSSCSKSRMKKHWGTGWTCRNIQYIPPVTTTNTLTTTKTLTTLPTDIIGYYAWTWFGGSVGPQGTTDSFAFSGFSDIDIAIHEYSSQSLPPLKGRKWISVGGGTSPGIMKVSDINKVIVSIDKIKAAGYTGVIFDIEHIIESSTKLIEASKICFKALKTAGIQVAVAPCNSGPWKSPTPKDAVDLVLYWVTEANIDFISPMLYRSGKETTPWFDETWNCSQETPGCTWQQYKGALPRFVPSIVDATHYPIVKKYFENLGITITGYIAYAQMF